MSHRRASTRQWFSWAVAPRQSSDGDCPARALSPGLRNRNLEIETRLAELPRRADNLTMPTPSEPHQATASEEPADHALDAGCAHLASLFHGDALNAERRTARDHDARQPEATAEGVSGRADAHDVGGEEAEGIDADWPIDMTELRELLLEAEVDRVAGRTFSAEEVRARCGLPPSGTR